MSRFAGLSRVLAAFARRLPGLAAAGLLLACPVMAQLGGFGGVGGFGGPSAVSSGYQPGDHTVLKTKFAPWVNVAGSYNRRLLDVEQTSPSFHNTYFGGAGNWGIGGARKFRGTSIAAQYAGVAVYTPRYASDKIRVSHVGSLAVDHALTNRLDLSAAFVGGTSIGGYGMGSGFGGFGAFGGNGGFGPGWLAATPVSSSNAFGDPASNGLVDQDVFGIRTKFYSSQASLGYRVNRGLTIGGGGGAYLVRRQSLVGLNGTLYNAFASYTLDSRNDIAFLAMRSTQDYINSITGVQIDNYGVAYARRLARRTHLRLTGGVNRLHSDYLGQVALAPELAAIVGAGSALQMLRYDKFSPTVSAGLSHAWQNSGFTLRYFRGITPGTDLFYAGQRENVTGSYSYSGLAHIGLNTNLGYFRARNDMVHTGLHKTENYFASVGASYFLGRGFSATASGGYRHGNFAQSAKRSDVYASVGISWSPGDVPFVR